MNVKTILILGGGVGGLTTANELRQRLSKEHRIVIIEKNAQHEFAPSFLWLMTGDRKPEQITRPVCQLLKSGIEVVEAEIQSIDIKNHIVITNAKNFEFDYLIVALGAELAPDIIPGLADNAHTFYTLDGAVKLRDALLEFRGGVVSVVVSTLPYKCPGAPHEGAMLLADFFSRRGLHGKTEIHLFTPEPQPMPSAGPVMGDVVRQMIESKGIVFHPQRKLVSVNPEKQDLNFEGQNSFHYDMLVAIPPHRAPRVVRESVLAGETGWIKADRAGLTTDYENVFALGDVAVIPVPGRWKPNVPMMLPKAGVFAHAQGETVAARIAAEINGLPTAAKFEGMGYCMLEAGGGKAGLAFGNFYAEPTTQLQLRNVGRIWHWGKVIFEKWWLAPLGTKRWILHQVMALGSRLTGIPFSK